MNSQALTDFVWMFRIRSVITNHEEGLPGLGKYNPGQKMMFWSQSLFVFTLFLSGLVLWDSNLPVLEKLIGFPLPMDYRRWAAVVHAVATVLATTMLIVHVYAAAIWAKGAMRP